MEVSHHELKDGAITNVKKLVFVLDQLAENPKNKKKKATLTPKNLGAHVNVSKLKANTSTMELAWRCRSPEENLSGISGMIF